MNWNKIEITDTCWNWTGAKSEGYGNFRLNSKLYSTHRFMYEMCYGRIKEGLDLDHLCRNRACCNPNHLEPVTRKENIRRSPIMGPITPSNSKKTHCKRGHEFTPENTDYRGINKRRCKQCRKLLRQ